MPIFDLYCNNCDYEKEDVILKVNEFNGDCPVCDYPLERAANTKSFKLLYDNKKDSVDWDGNRSTYYDEYNKQKAEGKNVRIAELDGDG